MLLSSAAMTLGVAAAAYSQAGHLVAIASEEIEQKSGDYISAGGVSLEELIRSMLARNLELQAMQQRLEQAEARLSQARLRPNPTVEFQHNNDRAFSNQGTREDELTFHQPLEIAGRRSRRIAVARVEVERIRYDVADLERRRTAELASLVGQALSESARLYALERVSELTDSLRGSTQLRVKVGDASQYEFTQIEAEATRLVSQRLRTANRLEELFIQIKTLAGVPVADRLKLRDAHVEPDEVTVSLDDALKIAAESRPDLKAAQMAEAEAEARIRLAKLGNTPDLGAIFGYKRSATASPAPVQSSDWQLKVGVSVALPVFNRNQGLIREGVAELAEARLHRENLEQMIRRDVTIAVRRLEQARRDVKLLEDRLVPLGQNSLRMARLGFDLGEIRLIDYISEQRRLVDIEISYAQAKADLFQAKVQLDSSTGRRLER